MLVLYFQDLPTLIFLRSKWNEGKKTDLICIVLMLMTTAGYWGCGGVQRWFLVFIFKIFFISLLVNFFVPGQFACGEWGSHPLRFILKAVVEICKHMLWVSLEE